MRERERRAEERRQLRADCFEVLKEVVDEVLLHPIFQHEFNNALKFARLSQERQQIAFDAMVERNARICLFGQPEYHVTPEFQCHYLVEMVDQLAHVRPALERAVVLYRESAKAMPAPLTAWQENPGTAPPRRRGPRAAKQDWIALRDQIIGIAISGAVAVQQSQDWPLELPIGRACSSGEKWRKNFSICRAVVEVLEERYGGNRDYQLPTYDMVWNAWRRYRKEIDNEGVLRQGRSLLPPKGLDSLLRPDGIDTEARQRHIAGITNDHLTRRTQGGIADDD